MKKWHTRQIGDFCTLVSGGTPSKHNPTYWVGDIPFVSARDLKHDRISSASLHISEEALQQSATKLAPVGSLLMLVRGMGLANGIQIGEVTSRVAFNQDIRAIQAPVDTVLARFLLLAIRSVVSAPGAEGVLSSAAHGTLKIDTDVLRRIMIPLPAVSEQRRIVAILDEAFESIAIARANAEKNLQNARDIFERRLDELFNNPNPAWLNASLDSFCEVKHGFAFDGQEFSSRVPAGRPIVVTPGNFTEDGRLSFTEGNTKRFSRPHQPRTGQCPRGKGIRQLRGLASRTGRGRGGGSSAAGTGRRCPHTGEKNHQVIGQESTQVVQRSE